MATKGLAKLKSEMVFNQDLSRLVDVMKGIAAAQYHVMERKLTSLDRYEKAMEELFEVYDFRLSSHPYVRVANARKLICLVTTDSGFLGGLNMKVLQAGMRHQDKGDHYLVIGERGANYLREFGRSYTAYPGVNPDDSRFSLVQRILEDITDLIRRREYGQAILVYPYSLSFTVQRVDVLNLIPCPLFFKNKPEQAASEEEQSRAVLLESPPDEIIEYLGQLWLRKRVIEIFESAKLSEYGARTMHLEESYQTLSKINKQLKLDYFKARREKIDQSLRETFTAQLIVKE